MNLPTHRTESNKYCYCWHMRFGSSRCAAGFHNCTANEIPKLKKKPFRRELYFSLQKLFRYHQVKLFPEKKSIRRIGKVSAIRPSPPVSVITRNKLVSAVPRWYTTNRVVHKLHQLGGMQTGRIFYLMIFTTAFIFILLPVLFASCFRASQMMVVDPVSKAEAKKKTKFVSEETASDFDSQKCFLYCPVVSKHN